LPILASLDPAIADYVEMQTQENFPHLKQFHFGENEKSIKTLKSLI
jgi:hypothetical protein